MKQIHVITTKLSSLIPHVSSNSIKYNLTTSCNSTGGMFRTLHPAHCSLLTHSDSVIIQCFHIVSIYWNKEQSTCIMGSNDTFT